MYICFVIFNCCIVFHNKICNDPFYYFLWTWPFCSISRISRLTEFLCSSLFILLNLNGYYFIRLFLFLAPSAKSQLLMSRNQAEKLLKKILPESSSIPSEIDAQHYLAILLISLFATIIFCLPNLQMACSQAFFLKAESASQLWKKLELWLPCIRF